MKTTHGEGEWLSQRLDALRPGWRGRLVVSAPEELESGDASEIVGTIVAEPSFERDAGDDSVTEAFFSVCPNYRDGRFLPTLGEPNILVRASRILDIEPM